MPTLNEQRVAIDAVLTNLTIVFTGMRRSGRLALTEQGLSCVVEQLTEARLAVKDALGTCDAQLREGAAELEEATRLLAKLMPPPARRRPAKDAFPQHPLPEEAGRVVLFRPRPGATGTPPKGGAA